MILGRILLIFCTYQFHSHQVQSAVSKTNLRCLPYPLFGPTFPKGNIMIEAGGTLEVNCTLDLTNSIMNGRNSRNIEFSFFKHEIPDDLKEKTIIDEATAMLRVKNMNASTAVVTCYLPAPYTAICENKIVVGYLPLPVENLKCVARNSALNCTWNKPQNNIDTYYSISLSIGNDHYYCPMLYQISPSNSTESCQWDGWEPVPHYSENRKIITSVMIGTNPLKPEGVRWRYEFNFWEIVIPPTPERVRVEAISPHEIKVSWFIDLMWFAPIYRITVCPVEVENECVVKEFKSNRNGDFAEQIVLPYANTMYRVDLKMKSQVAIDKPEWWSSPDVHPSVRTLPKRPEFPPQIGIGTFQVFNKHQLRDIKIY